VLVLSMTKRNEKSMLSTKKCLGITAMVAALTLVGCASGTAEKENDTDASGAASAVDAELQALLPEDLREGGSIAVGSSLAAPPTNFIDENEKPIGLYVEALELAGSKLGITIEWVQIPF